MLGNVFSIALKLAKQKGFKTSIITNGHYLLNNKINLPRDVLDMVGISFDSQSLSTRKQIGRVDRKGNSLGADDLKLVLEHLAQSQQGIKTKINTVVNKLNWQEDFSALIADLKPYKWKLLHVMPFGDCNLLISKNKFNKFVERHSDLGLPVFAESNSAMTESYLMIDPQGRFYQNSSSGVGYQFSDCINQCGVDAALAQIKFNTETFSSRYEYPVLNMNLIKA